MDSSGNFGPINSSKAQQRMDEYIAGVKRATQEHEEQEGDGEHEHHEDTEEVEQGEGQGPEYEQELNAKVLYDVSGSMTSHGRFAIGYGAVRAADVRAAAKENNVSRSKSVSMQMLARQNAELRQENARLQKEKDSAMQQGKVAIDLTMGLYRRLGLQAEIPEASLRLAAVAQGIATDSSHVGSESTNDGNATDGLDEDNPNARYRAAFRTVNRHCGSGNHA